MPWRQSMSVPKQSNVSHRSVKCALRAPGAKLAAGRPVRQRLLRGRVDLFGSQKHGCLHARQRSARANSHGKGERSLVVDAVRDDVDVRVAESEIDALEPPA